MLDRDALAPMRFRLIDDGTLDTVFLCERCGNELRYIYQPDEDFFEEDGLSAEEQRVKFFRELVESDHVTECLDMV